jgi:hypothetical protein
MVPVQFWQEGPQCEGWLRSRQLVPPQSAVPAAQLLAHPIVPSVRQPYMHDIIVDAVHAPEPLHRAPVVATPFVQLAAAPHDVVVEGNTQAARWAALPSQIPAQAPVPPHGVRGVVTGVHVPLAEAVEHDSHWPAQAALQQTPSAQCPVVHSESCMHDVPASRPTQTPPLLHTGVVPLQPPQQVASGTQLPLHSFIVPEHPGPPPAPPPVEVIPPVPGTPPVPAPPLPLPIPAIPVVVPPAPPEEAPPLPVDAFEPAAPPLPTVGAPPVPGCPPEAASVPPPPDTLAPPRPPVATPVAPPAPPEPAAGVPPAPPSTSAFWRGEPHATAATSATPSATRKKRPE